MEKIVVHNFPKCLRKNSRYQTFFFRHHKKRNLVVHCVYFFFDVLRMCCFSLAVVKTSLFYCLNSTIRYEHNTLWKFCVKSIFTWPDLYFVIFLIIEQCISTEKEKDSEFFFKFFKFLIWSSNEQRSFKEQFCCCW